MPNQPIETERLILREILPSDKEAMFEMDSDPEVHKFLGNNPLKSIREAEAVIAFIRQQYKDNGIGRWAVVEKSTGNFVGWSGLKLIKEHTNGYVNYYDLGYRLLRKYWGNGYATESAQAWLREGFTSLQQEKIYAITNTVNFNSKKVLEKSGLTCKEVFSFDDAPHYWFSIDKAQWLNLISKSV
jgi:RimJ/RimL family protein N-acetyltransferase